MEGFNQPTQNQPAKPNNNMPLAIVGTILGICSPLCCLIGMGIGIVGIVFASQVNTKYNANDYTGAETAAKNAKIMAYIAIALGIVGLIVAIIQIITMGGISGYMERYQEMLDGMR